jgi:hypothetical protein
MKTMIANMGENIGLGEADSRSILTFDESN